MSRTLQIVQKKGETGLNAVNILGDQGRVLQHSSIRDSSLQLGQSKAGREVRSEAWEGILEQLPAPLSAQEGVYICRTCARGEHKSVAEDQNNQNS